MKITKIDDLSRSNMIFITKYMFNSFIRKNIKESTRDTQYIKNDVSHFAKELNV
jgi:hypothetical protein